MEIAERRHETHVASVPKGTELVAVHSVHDLFVLHCASELAIHCAQICTKESWKENARNAGMFSLSVKEMTASNSNQASVRILKHLLVSSILFLPTTGVVAHGLSMFDFPFFPSLVTPVDLPCP